MASARASLTTYQKDLATIAEAKAEVEREKGAITVRCDKLQKHVDALQQEKGNIQSS
jgi:hypothetical protein